jgi:LacI family transcriptional regulator
MIKKERQISGIRKVGVIIGYMGTGYDLAVMRGILRFSQFQGTWEFHTHPDGLPFLDKKSIATFNADGIITAYGSSEILEKLKQLGTPAVTISGNLNENPIPSVTTNSTIVGEIGAKHLLDLPISNFAFISDRDAAYSRERQAGFTDIINSAGYKTRCYTLTDSTPSEKVLAGLRKFLISLPKPAGIMTDHDKTAVYIIASCRMSGISVPADVAVIGVNNNDIICDMSHPSLTSIELDAHRIGFEAARMLEQLMSGENPDVTDLKIPPVSVVERNSTNLLHPGDDAISISLRYIHTQAHRFLKVSDVVRASCVSRRTLEKKFRGNLGRTIYDEIQNAHLKRARHLLRNTDWSLRRIARESGYNETSRFHESFKRVYGKTPKTYRSNAGGIPV